MSPQDLKDREEQAAGNADDASNPGNRHYNEDLINNKKKASDEEIDDDFDAILAANGLDAPEEDIDSHGDKRKRNYNADDTNGSQKELQGRETNPNFYSNNEPSKKPERSSLLGKSASMALLGSGAAMIAIVGMLGNLASSILPNMKEIFHNDQASSYRTNTNYRNAMYASKLTKGSCNNVLPILCRFQSISEKQKTNMERARFTVVEAGKTGPPLNRIKIDHIITPNGKIIRTGAELHAWANASSENARHMRFANMGKAAFWMNEKFNSVLSKFSLDKAKKLIGKNKQELDRDIDSRTNGASTEGTDAERRTSAEDRARQNGENELKTNGTDKIKARAGGIAGWATLVPVVGCGAYNMSNMIAAYAKRYHIDQMVNYAMIFMNTADRIKDQGDIEPDIVDYAASIMTNGDPKEKTTGEAGNSIDNPNFNKSATDAEAYEIAAHGGSAELTEDAKKYRVGGYRDDSVTEWIDDVSNTNRSLESLASAFNPSSGNFSGGLGSLWDSAKIAASIAGNGGDFSSTLQQYANANSGNSQTGQQTIRWMCSNGPVAGLVANIVICAASFGVACAAIAACIAGGIAGGISDALNVCGNAKDKAIELAEKAADELGITDAVLSYLQSTVIGSFTKYTGAGNAWGAGNAFLAESTSMGYGLRPAKDREETQTFLAATNPDIAMDAQLAVEDARSDPFDITNKYSFLGMVVRGMGIEDESSQTPVLSLLSSALSLPLKAAAFGQQPIHAFYSQPILDSDSRYDCKDPDLERIGITEADKFCSTVGITPNAELTLARQQVSGEVDWIAENVTYMTESQDRPEGEEGGTTGGTKDDSFCDIPGVGGMAIGSAIPGVSSVFYGGKKNCLEVRQDSDLPSVDKNGAVTKGSQYEKYINYCTDKRKDPWGLFSEEIQVAASNRDLDWMTGRQCLKDTNMMRHFRTFYNMCAQSATMDETSDCSSDDTAQALGSVTPNTGDWVVPTSGPCLSPYGMRWGSLHAGIDISPPSGTPIVAPTSMTITFAGMNSGGYGYMVTGKATDGTNYSFRFGHMLGQPPVSAGQQVAKGQQIGEVGSTGNSTGPHLHFEIFPPGGDPATYSGSVDPVPILAQNGVSLSCG